MKALSIPVFVAIAFALGAVVYFGARFRTSSVVVDNPVEAEYVRAGQWSRYYAPGQLKDVSSAYDREWQLVTLDHWTKKEMEGFIDALPSGPVLLPYNTVKVRFRSPKYGLKITYTMQEPPKP